MKVAVALVLGGVVFDAVISVTGEAAAQLVPNQNQNNNISPRIRNTVNPATNSNSNAAGGAATANPSATANPNSSSGAMANPTASSGSSSVAVTTGSQNTIYPAAQSITTVPMVYTPGVSTGNVCALGASAGASWLGAGFAVGTSWESMQCERRQTAALLYNMGTPESRAAAKEVLCNSPEIRHAYQTIGHPCSADLMRVAGPATSQQPSAAHQVTIAKTSSFNPARYRTAADCMTNAYTAGAPLSLCAGKP